MPPEFSRLLPLGLVGPVDRTERLEASPAERAALAERFGIPAIASLVADLTLRLELDGTVKVTGWLDAAVTQACVVSFEPVAQRVAEAVAFRVLPPGREPAEAPDQIDEIAAVDAAGHGIGQGAADLGEAIAEQLSLALDPYPRAPDAALPAEARDDAGPFGSLAALRRPH